MKINAAAASAAGLPKITDAAIGTAAGKAAAGCRECARLLLEDLHRCCFASCRLPVIPWLKTVVLSEGKHARSLADRYNKLFRTGP